MCVEPRSRGRRRPFSSVPPLQWVGRHSYALYLWHWPALVLAEAEWGPLSWSQRFAAIAVAVGASALSVRLVEDPVRHSRYFSAVSWRSLYLGLAMCVLMVGIGVDLRSNEVRLDGGIEAAAPQLAAVTTVTPQRPRRPNELRRHCSDHRVGGDLDRGGDHAGGP